MQLWLGQNTTNQKKLHFAKWVDKTLNQTKHQNMVYGYMDMAFKLSLKVMDNKTRPSNLHMVVTNVNSEELVKMIILQMKVLMTTSS